MSTIPSASGGEQRPATDTFDEITAHFAPVSPWNAAWQEAEQQLLEERPQGFHVEDIGRLAYDRLHKVWQPGARDSMFYAYWVARQDHPEELARLEAALPLHTKAADLLDEVESLLAQGAEVSPRLVTVLVSLARTLLGGGSR